MPNKDKSSVYLAIKYHADNKNKALIEAITQACKKTGLDCLCIAKDVEKWGERSFTAEELMAISFEHIRESDLVLIEFSEKGVGIGIEAGYAFALNIPIYVIHPPLADISNTLKGIAANVIPYTNQADIESILLKITQDQRSNT